MADFVEKGLTSPPDPSLEKLDLVKETIATESSVGDVEYVSLSPEEDRSLTMKIDLKIMPIMGLIYLIVFLDRTNIANAKIAGLVEGLHMPANGYNTALWIFYIPFVLAEVPSNYFLSLSWVKPNLFLGTQMFILGILGMCEGLTQSYRGFLALRFLMGCIEISLPAGAALLIASYYRKKELSFRYALFFAFGDFGACFSGLMAYAIMETHTDGLAGWRWIFMIEGWVTLFVAILVFIFIPNFPAKDKWLSERDRTNLIARIDADRGRDNKSLRETSWLNILADYKIWLCTLLFFCADMSAGSLSSYNPTILSQLGWTNRRAQVMTIPVWIVGIAGALLSTLASDVLNKRWPFIYPSIAISMVGWIIHVTYQAPGVRYFAQFLIAFGTFIQMPLYIGMLTANLRGKARLGLGVGVILGLGNCANFVSSNVFISTQAPHYPVGFGTGLGLTCLAFPTMTLLVVCFRAHNKRIDRMRAELQLGEELDDQEYYYYVY